MPIRFAYRYQTIFLMRLAGFIFAEQSPVSLFYSLLFHLNAEEASAVGGLNL